MPCDSRPDAMRPYALTLVVSSLLLGACEGDGGRRIGGEAVVARMVWNQYGSVTWSSRCALLSGHHDLDRLTARSTPRSSNAASLDSSIFG